MPIASRGNVPRRESINWPLLVLVGLVVFSVRKSLPLPATGKAGAKRMPRPGVEWSDDDALAFTQAVKAAGVPVDAALQVYAAESGLDPQASSGIAWGLAQFVGKTLKGLGWQRSAAEFGGLTVAEQAPWVTKLLKAQVAMLGRAPSSALDLYVLNFWPAAARAGYDVILVRDSRVAKEREAYEKNKGLDRARKGYITRGDLQTSLDRVVHLPALGRVQAQIRRLAA